MHRGIIFEGDDIVHVRTLAREDRTRGRPKRYVECLLLPNLDSDGFGGLMIGDTFGLVDERIGLQGAFVYLGFVEEQFHFGSVETW